MKQTNQQRANWLWIGVIVLGVILNACGPAGMTSEPKGSLMQSKVQRIVDPLVLADDLADLVDGNRTFGLDFYQKIREKAGNQFFSPYSLSTALAMTYGGARGITEDKWPLCSILTSPRRAFTRLLMPWTSR